MLKLDKLNKLERLKRLKKNTVSFFENGRNFYIILFAAMLVKNFPFGFRYFLYSDDYNAYGVYSLWNENLWHNVIVPFNIYGYRPLAGIVDVYIISRLWENLQFVLLAIVIMHFATIYLLDALFKKSNIIWGRAAAVFFGFYPTLTESAYWISASSRIVPAAFFGVAAVFAMLKFVYKEGRHWLWFTAAVICGLLAQGFYEQGIVFTLVLSVGILITHRKAVKHKILFAWPFINLAVIGTHYYIFRDVGWFGVRAQTAEYSLFRQISTVTDRIITTFIEEQRPTLTNSLRWGIAQLFTEHLPLALLVTAFTLLLALFIAFDKSPEVGFKFKVKTKNPDGATEAADEADETEGQTEIKRETEAETEMVGIVTDKKTAYSLLTAFVLTVCTFAVFFVLADSWIWVRNFFYAVIGLSMFAEIASRCIRVSKHRILGLGVKMTAAFIVTFIFFCGFILETDSLRLVEKYDNIIVSNLIAEVERLGLEDADADTIWFFGLRWTYAPKINPRIASQIRLDWAIHGHYSALSRRYSNRRIIPVMNGDSANVDFERDVLIGLDGDLNARELAFGGHYLTFADTGVIFGSINLEENGRFRQY